MTSDHRHAKVEQARGSCELQDAGTIDLYFYDELPLFERERVEAHLPGCARCREALTELEEIRDALAARPVVSGPASADWSAFMTRLERAVGKDMPARASHRYGGYLAMAALLALVTISVVVAARWRAPEHPRIAQGNTATAPPPADTGSAPDEVSALAAVSGQHFERSKLVVLGLATKDPGTAATEDWEYERQLAGRLLADTKLYRLAAEDRGMRDVAGVMRDLEVVLLQVSMADAADPATLAQVQRLIRKRDLVQKMNVVGTTGL